MRRVRRYLPILAIGVIVAAACQPTKPPPTPPPPWVPVASNVIDFEPAPYALGTVNAQDGWVATGAFDQEVVATSGFTGDPAEFETQSWRVSNAVTSGSFGDQPFSKPLTVEAGESDALHNGAGSGNRQPYFETEFTVVSSNDVIQPGARITISPDRGDGARMSFLALEHTANDLVVSFSDVQGVPVTQPCSGCANFVTTPIATLDETVPHTIKLQMVFVPGPSNDLVSVAVDGALVHLGTSWENYYRFDGESNAGQTPPFVSRTVDSLLFRMSGAAVPSVDNNGFLLDNLSLASGPVPT